MVKTWPFNAARYEDEPFDVYQLRRWNENRFFDWLLMPAVVWPSFYRGTYRKKEHGQLPGSETGSET